MPKLRCISLNRKPCSRLAIGALIGLTVLQPVLQAASSLPSGGSFVAGSGSISTSGNTLTINQNSLRGIIDWNTFSLSQGSGVNFRNGSGSTLNRVTGGAPSSLLGQILATGSVYLINPQGVLIGRGATIHTGGDFLASTLPISNGAFLKGGPLTFSGPSRATVVNLGAISSSGGSVYLIGNSVQNDGAISAANGTAALASGGQVLIADSLTGQRVSVQAPGGDVTNSGFINAAQAELKSNGGNIYALAGNNGGQINATGTATQDGRVWLIAENGNTSVSGLISAANANGASGSIETSGAHVVTTAATIKTGKNGNWLLDPDDLNIDSTLAGTIETSLNSGTNVTEQTSVPVAGGFGDITVASPVSWNSGANLTLSAYRNVALNAGVSNTGSGSLTVRADNTASGTGTISGAGLIDFSASTGNVALLYNPVVFGTPDYAANFGTVNGAWAAPANGSVSGQYTSYMLVNSAANLQNLDVNDAGVYALGKDLDLSSLPNFAPLGSTSPNFTGILDGMGHTLSNLSISASSGDVGLFSQIGAGGQVRNLNLTSAAITQSSYGADYIGLLAGENAGVISNVSVSGTAELGYYTYSQGGLVGRQTGSINGSSAAVVFDTTQATEFYYLGGLVGDNSGTINNSFATEAVSMNGANGIGGLAGYSSGVISNSYASGAVTGTNVTYAGGLIGDNEAAITNSYATGNITGGEHAGGLAGASAAAITGSHASGIVLGDGSTYRLGGLVGDTSSGDITGSYATGSVTCTAYCGYVGGLVGESGSIITNSYATGAVSSGDYPDIGGLVGRNYVAISGSHATGSITTGNYSHAGGLSGGTFGPITNSYATGSVTAADSSSVGGLAGVSGSPISGSYAIGAATGGASVHVGGLVGTTYSGGTIDTSYSIGPVTAGTAAYAGGLVGQSADSITTSYSISTVTAGGASYAGGLVGQSGAPVSISYAMGDVSAGGDSTIGGLVGWATSSLTDTYARGAVTIAATGEQAAGGLVGELDSAGSITRSYSSGLVTNSFSGGAGGLVGFNNGTANITFSYWDYQASGFPSVAVGSGDSTGTTPLTTAQLQSGVMPTGYNPDPDHSPWVAPASVYPYFGWQGPLVTISGNAYDGLFSGNDIPNAGVNALSRGFLLGSTITDSNGAYTLSAPTNMVQSGVLTYLTSNGAANSFSDGGPSTSFTGMSLFNGTLYTMNTAQPTQSGLAASLKSTVGGYTGPNFLYTVPNGQLNLTVGTNLLGFNAVPTLTIDQSPAGAGAIILENFGNLNIATGQSLIASPANPIYLIVVGAFTNNAGPEALNVSGGAVWRVLSPSPLNDTTGGLAEDFIQYGAGFEDILSSPHPGNGFLYLLAPSLTATLSGSFTKTYDGTTTASLPANALSYTGAMQGDAVNLTSSGLPTYNDPNANSNVGVSLSGISIGSAFHGEIPVYGYQLSNSTALSSGTINPATLTFAANPVSQTYGSTNSPFSGTLTGFVNNETASTATGGTLLFSSPAVPGSNVGTYAINGSGLTASNYVFSQAGGNASALTINPATLTYTANSVSQTYGSINSPFSGTLTGFVNNETASTATSGTLLFSSPAVPGSNVGTYAINGSGLTASNYVFSQTGGNASALTITPATLTYTANPVDQTASLSLPVFTGTVTGFVNNETLVSATTGSVAFTSPATLMSAAGSYAIDGSGLTANHGNYVFTQAASNATAFTLEALPPATPTPTPEPPPGHTVLTFAVNNTIGLQNSNPAFTATYTGEAISGLNIASILAGLTYVVSPYPGPGTYEITATGVAPAGYVFSIQPGTLTIVGSSPAILPSLATMTSPILPELLIHDNSSLVNLLQPLNSVGLFQIGITSADYSIGSSFASFGMQQAPLSQSSFFIENNEKRDTFAAGAKP